MDHVIVIVASIVVEILAKIVRKREDAPRIFPGLINSSVEGEAFVWWEKNWTVMFVTRVLEMTTRYPAIVEAGLFGNMYSL